MITKYICNKCPSPCMIEIETNCIEPSPAFCPCFAYNEAEWRKVCEECGKMGVEAEWRKVCKECGE